MVLITGVLITGIHCISIIGMYLLYTHITTNNFTFKYITIQLRDNDNVFMEFIITNRGACALIYEGYKYHIYIRGRDIRIPISRQNGSWRNETNPLDLSS